MKITIERIDGGRWLIGCGPYFSFPTSLPEAILRLELLNEAIEDYKLRGWSTDTPDDVERFCKHRLGLFTYEEAVFFAGRSAWWSPLVHPQDIAGLLTYRPEAAA
jgi:hypothetical protein